MKNSDSNVAITASRSPPSIKTQRNKRQRQSSEEQLCTFKEEIKNMLDEWKGTQNTLLNKLVSEIHEIKEQNNQIKLTNDEIEKSLIFINKQYEDLKTKVEVLESERKEHLLKIALLESSMEDIQRNYKSSSIELRNIPKLSTTESKADLCNTILSTCKVLNVKLPDNAIKDVFRVSGKSGKSSIVADLATCILKNDIIQRAKFYNKEHSERRLNSADIGLIGQPTPIYISEALTNKGRRLFFLARDLAKSKEYKFCWTNNGKIFVRKDIQATRIEIKDELQLLTLRKL